MIVEFVLFILLLLLLLLLLFWGGQLRGNAAQAEAAEGLQPGQVPGCHRPADFAKLPRHQHAILAGVFLGVCHAQFFSCLRFYKMGMSEFSGSVPTSHPHIALLSVCFPFPPAVPHTCHLDFDRTLGVKPDPDASRISLVAHRHL